MVLQAQSTTKDYIRDEGDSDKEINSWKYWIRQNVRLEEQSEKAMSCRREFMEWNTVETATKTNTDTRTELKGVGKLNWFMSKT